MESTAERRSRPPPPPTTLPQAIATTSGSSSSNVVGRCDSPSNQANHASAVARDSPRSRDMKALSASLRTNRKLQEQFDGRSTPEPPLQRPAAPVSDTAAHPTATNNSSDSFASPIRFQPNRIPVNTSLGGPSPRREASPQVAPAAPLPEPSPERSTEERRDHLHSKLHRPGGSRIESVVSRRVTDPQFRRREPLPTHPLLPLLEPAASSRENSEHRNVASAYPPLLPSREVSPDVKRPMTNITLQPDTYAAAVEPTLRKAPLLPVGAEPPNEPLVLSVLVKGNRTIPHPLAKPQVLELTINQDSHLVSTIVVVANVISLLQATANAFEAKDGTTPTASASPLREPSQPLNSQCRSVVFPVQIGRQLIATAAVLFQDEFRLPMDALITSCSNVDRLYTLDITFALSAPSPEQLQEPPRRVVRETTRCAPATFQDPTVLRFAQRLETVESYLKDLSTVKKADESMAVAPLVAGPVADATLPTHCTPPPSPPPRHHRATDLESQPQQPQLLEEDLSLEESFAKLKKKMLLSPILNESREVATLDETSSDSGKGKIERELLMVETARSTIRTDTDEGAGRLSASTGSRPPEQSRPVTRDSYTVRAEKIEFLARSSRNEREEMLSEARRVMDERIALVNWMREHFEENLADHEGHCHVRTAPTAAASPMVAPRLLDASTSDMQLEYDSVLDIWRLKRKS